MTTIVLSFPEEVSRMAHLLAVRFLLPSLLGRLIIMQVRFLYLFHWLRTVLWGTVEVLCSGSHHLLQNTFTRCHRSFPVHGFVYNKFVCNTKSVTNYIQHFSVCLHVCCSYDLLLLYKTRCVGPCASSPLKHEAYAKSCCGLALQESLWGSDFISHNPEL